MTFDAAILVAVVVVEAICLVGMLLAMGALWNAPA